MQEQENNPIPGYPMFALLLAVIVGVIFSVVNELVPFIILGTIAALFLAKGFFFVNPNDSKVLVLFGDYKGTVKKNGFFWTNPFYAKQAISLRARNFDSEKIKVNDLLGNPILISSILVWRVKDTYKAAFDVDYYESFVKIQTDAAVRKLAGSYPYDNFDDEQTEITLRSGMQEVNEAMEGELSERLAISGIEVLEARIGYLAYAPEIASAMLKRQQAEAIVAARFKIVEGAVGMVELALDELSKKQVIELDEHQKATMV
ncbi:MAG: SPFH domain-containing protein, partial [Saprospiraceae bacterium]